MIKLTDTLEILLYTFLDLIPCLILAILPFRKLLRFSPKRTCLFVCPLFLMVFASRLLTFAGSPFAKLFTVLWIGLYLVFYVITIKTPIYKLLFVLLTILNYGSFKAVIVLWLLRCLSAGTAQRYSLLSSLLLLVVYLFSWPLMYYMMKHQLRPLIDIPDERRYWHFLWLIPATFCLSYYYNLFANGGTAAFSAKGGNVLFAILFNMGALFVTHLMLKLLEECNAKLLLEQENYYLNMQSVQYDNLKLRMEEARRARHDLRQNLSVIQSCLQKKEYQKLSDYIHEYIQTLPPDSPIMYCEDYALNALLVYYENMARDYRIQFKADIRYPAECSICSPDAVILFGNLLENAIEACTRSKANEPFISLCTKSIHNMIVITMDNTCGFSTLQCSDGLFSSKSPRMGIGTVSIRQIAEKYHGTAQFRQENGVFYSSVLLNPDASSNSK
ncbi:MAG: GHKL domain-containing protein [Bacillota bacterium]|nr:GHKL domain-containing protein [Bacillota bacterium]